jgi:hypothetical protein
MRLVDGYPEGLEVRNVGGRSSLYLYIVHARSLATTTPSFASNDDPVLSSGVGWSHGCPG